MKHLPPTWRGRNPYEGGRETSAVSPKPGKSPDNRCVRNQETSLPWVSRNPFCFMKSCIQESTLLLYMQQGYAALKRFLRSRLVASSCLSAIRTDDARPVDSEKVASLYIILPPSWIDGQIHLKHELLITLPSQILSSDYSMFEQVPLCSLAHRGEPCDGYKRMREPPFCRCITTIKSIEQTIDTSPSLSNILS